MKSLRLFIWLTVLTGIIYPMLITAISELAMRKKAHGSLVFDQSQQMVGSLLIGQQFSQEKYFWPRPSASNYQTLPSSGSNLGPTSKALIHAVEQRKKLFAQTQEIPSDLLFASASGLDPHITVEAALFQIGRIARARNIEREKIEKLIQQLIEKRTLGFLGTPRINVLKLNIKLDELE